MLTAAVQLTLQPPRGYTQPSHRCTHFGTPSGSIANLSVDFMWCLHRRVGGADPP